ncbi:phospholipid-transporting ATPase 1, partial [Tanacetum coccineum]
MANIKVWVLTGDKQETAISIGYYSKLLTSNVKQIIINNNSVESCKRSLKDALKLSPNATSGDNESSLALIIDGTSLVHILDSKLEDK